jgi:hypothetical protein
MRFCQCSQVDDPIVKITNDSQLALRDCLGTDPRSHAAALGGSELVNRCLLHVLDDTQMFQRRRREPAACTSAAKTVEGVEHRLVE